MPWEDGVWGVGFVIRGGGCQKFAGPGQQVSIQLLTNKKSHTHQNATTNPPFLLSPDTLCCNELD